MISSRSTAGSTIEGIVNKLAPLISYLLTFSTWLLGIVCIAFPVQTIYFLIPSEYSYGSTAANDYANGNANDTNISDDMNMNMNMNATTNEQFLIRLIGSILIAYATTSFTVTAATLTTANTTNATATDVTTTTTNNNNNNNNNNHTDIDTSNSNSNNNNNTRIGESKSKEAVQQASTHTARITLASSVYLGLSLLLIVIFQLVTTDLLTITTTTDSNSHGHSNSNGDSNSLSESNNNNNNNNMDNNNDNNDNNRLDDNIKFVHLIIISTVFIILSLMGLIASFFPTSDESTGTGTTIDTNTDINTDTNTSMTHYLPCGCWWKSNRTSSSRLSLPLYDDTVNHESNNYHDDHDDSPSAPLLPNDHMQEQGNNNNNNNNNNSTNHDNMQEQDNNNTSEDQHQHQHQHQNDEFDNHPHELEQQQLQQQQQQNEPTESQSRIKGSRRLIKLAGPHTFSLFIGCLVLLIRLPFSLSIPHFISVTIGALARSQYDVAKMNIFLLFIFGTIDAILDFFCIYLFGLANLNISRGVRKQLFTALLQQEIGFFDKNKSGDLTSRLNSDCGDMSNDLTWFFRFSIESTVRIVGIVIYMSLRAPKLALCAVSVVPFVALVNKKYGDWLSTNAKDVQTALAEANSVAQEALLCIRSIIAFASERLELTKYNTKIDDHYKLNVKQLFATGFYYMVISTFLINTCVTALILYVGMVLIQNHNIQADVLLAFMLYQSQLQNEVVNLFNSYTSLIKSSGAGDKVFQLLDRVIPEPGTGSSNHLAMELQFSTIAMGDISIRDVDFAYPERPDEMVLRNLNLDINTGETVALIGKSGCGKSTIFSLLQRFYDPCHGNITVNGMTIKNMNVVNYRQNMSIVSQEPVLFTGTIRSNIAYCVPDESEDVIIEAAKLANAHSFIEKFPDGYNTQVGERGIQLSGGQRQRIAIARAILSKPKLLLLDEATSALDGESEELVQRALDSLLETRRSEMTTIVIAHRLQTIRHADKIVVLQDGKVAEEGTHDMLMQSCCSLYSQMIQKGEES